MRDQTSSSRRKVIAKLEGIIGAECYNGSIQNYGPGGYREAAGRCFRYPLTVRQTDGSKERIRNQYVPDTISDEVFRSGYYAFGANQLDVVSALDKILKYLELHHDLVLRDDR